MGIFKGKVAIVSGGANSLGAAIVRRFCDAGAKVLVADLDGEAGKLIAGEGRDSIRFVRTDLRKEADVEASVAAAREFGQRIDIVVNAAAVYDDAGADSSREQWHNTFDTNLFGQARLIAAARPHLAVAGGCVVNIGSISANAAQAGRWTYPASKAALVHLTRTMAVDFAGDNIRVNSVSPGWTWSNGMAAMGLKREQIDKVAADYHLFGRAADPEEIAGPVLFLCSHDARFITGADLAVDGGYSAMGPEGRPPALSKLAGLLGA
jgi:NAD(P)-dependent dehydrogenase (short-subunit alcohol dehydrogenase family)